MTNPTAPSAFSRYVWNKKCLAFICVCAVIVVGVVYFTVFNKKGGANKSGINSELPSNQSIQTITSMPDIAIWENSAEIQLFRKYLQIPTAHPNVSYEYCVAFLRNQAAYLYLPFKVYYPVNDQNPVVVMTWEGEMPELPSIMLNSHMDVVPVYPEFWTHPPFAAEMDEYGDIFARGAQDMKSVGMQYLEAIRRLKRGSVGPFKRTVHVVFVPDEEMGGTFGMAGFVESDAFKSMNVGFVLDEGGTAIDDNGTLPVFYAERTIWQIEFIFRGHSGHGSLLFNGTASEKFNYVLGKLTEFREEEARKLNKLNYPYGNVTTINLTIVKAGVESNVIPPEIEAIFDIRISANADLDEFEKQLWTWCEEAGGNITMNFLQKRGKEKATPVDDSNPFWKAFNQAVEEVGIDVRPTVLGASSDMKYIRNLNISALGFSPLLNTIPKLHDHDEYLNAEVYLNGIKVYANIIPRLADV